jgi:transcriptional regulator with PAS, ATPase and Fis domain
VRGKAVTEERLPLPQHREPATKPVESRPQSAKSLYEAVEALERQMIHDALTASGRNKLKASQRWA